MFEENKSLSDLDHVKSLSLTTEKTNLQMYANWN